jgi:hypothetical protein
MTDYPGTGLTRKGAPWRWFANVNFPIPPQVPLSLWMHMLTELSKAHEYSGFGGEERVHFTIYIKIY